MGTAASGESWAPATVPAQPQKQLPPTEDRSALRTQLQLDALKPSSAVRLFTRDGKYVSGSYDGHDAAHARVTGDSSIVVPIENVIAIAQQRPATGQFARAGLVIGALSGAVGFGILAAASEGNRDDGQLVACPCGLGGMIPTMVAFGAVSGGATGLMIGSLIGSVTKRWQLHAW
jgi:hypothetical protein